MRCIIIPAHKRKGKPVKQHIRCYRAKKGAASGVEALITPATVRSADPVTARLKSLTDEYSEIASLMASGQATDSQLRRFEQLEKDILTDWQDHIKKQTANIKGVDAVFAPSYLGAWEGSFEPSLNLSFEISDGAEVRKLENLLYDVATQTSQDAFIIEGVSNFHGDKSTTPLTLVDNDGWLHYPQIRPTFTRQLSSREKSSLAKALTANGVEEFSIDGDYVNISVIDFSTEDYGKKKENFEATIKSIYRGINSANVGAGFKSTGYRIRKSRFIESRESASGRKSKQTRSYNRSNFLKGYKP